jgi:hypothetical protein
VALHLVDKLLRGDPAVIPLMADGPFRRAPPRYIRAELFRYRFAIGDRRAWWRRTRQGTYLPPLGPGQPPPHRHAPGLRLGAPEKGLDNASHSSISFEL